MSPPATCSSSTFSPATVPEAAGSDTPSAEAGYVMRLSPPVIDGAGAGIAVEREYDAWEGSVHEIHGVGEACRGER